MVNNPSRLRTSGIAPWSIDLHTLTQHAISQSLADTKMQRRVKRACTQIYIPLEICRMGPSPAGTRCGETRLSDRHGIQLQKLYFGELCPVFSLQA